MTIQHFRLPELHEGFLGGTIPESEVRQDFRIGQDGTVGEWLGHGNPNQSVMLEEERFHSIETPLLAIFSYPSAPYPSQTSDPAKLAASRAAETSREEAQIAIFREQPHAKVIVIPNATHYIFLSREEEVISQITEFVNSLLPSIKRVVGIHSIPELCCAVCFVSFAPAMFGGLWLGGGPPCRLSWPRRQRLIASPQNA